MPFSGDFVFPSDVTAIGRVATSAARLAAVGSNDGDLLYQTDRQWWFRWNAATSAWVALPQTISKYVGGAADPIGSSFTTSVTTIYTGSAITVPASTNHWVDLSICFSPYAGNETEAKLEFFDDTTEILIDYIRIYTSAGRKQVSLGWEWTSGAGSGGETTFTPIIKCSRVYGSSTCKFLSDSTNPFNIKLSTI